MGIYWYFLKKILKKAYQIGYKGMFVLSVFIFILFIYQYFTFSRPEISTDYTQVLEKNREVLYSRINDPELNKTTHGKITIAIFKIITCKLVGEACTDNPKDADANFNKSFLGFAHGMITAPLQYPPASGIQTVSETLANAGLIPKTHAAEGIGMASIKPLAKIWTVTRNTAYLIIVLVIVAVGFMIMFRMKLNPQTVISIENALPKIVIALILITFSFAIVGFLIDLMYVAIAVIIAILTQGATLKYTTAELQNRFITAGPGGLLDVLSQYSPWNILWKLPSEMLSVVPVLNFLTRIIGLILSIYLIWPWFNNNLLMRINEIVGVPIAAMFQPVGIGASIDIDGVVKQGTNLMLTALVVGIVWAIGVYFLFPLLIGLVIGLSVIMIFFRLFFLIISSYAKLILLTILAPLYLLLEAVPGQKTFSTWFKSLLAELSTFPIIIGISVISMVIVSNIQNTTTNFISLPFLFSINAETLTFVVSMWMLFMIPEFIALAHKAINPKPPPIDAGLGVFFGGAKGGLESGVSEISKYALLASNMPGTFGKLLGRFGLGKR